MDEINLRSYFVQGNHSVCRNLFDTNQHYATTDNFESSCPDISHIRHYNKEGRGWLQGTLSCNKPNYDIHASTNQLPYEMQTQAGQQIQQKICQQTPSIYHNRVGKFHRAHISLIRTSEGSCEAIIKTKRKRTVFTTEQIKALDKYFHQKPYITREERQKLVHKLKLNDKAVKIWFQNRRLKDKRDQEPQAPLNSFVLNKKTLQTCLGIVETQVYERTNQLGYVTLDDILTENIGSLINTVLPNNTNIDLSSDSSTTESGSGPIYEPISPPEYIFEEEYPEILKL